MDACGSAGCLAGAADSHARRVSGSALLSAKKLAYRQVGDQRLPMPKTRIERVNPDDENDKRTKIVGRTINETLPPHTRRIFFEQHLPKRALARRWIRCNAVIKFCQAVNATRAAMEEKTLAWDRAAQAHDRHCMLREDTFVPTIADQTKRRGGQAGKRKRVDQPRDDQGAGDWIATAKMPLREATQDTTGDDGTPGQAAQPRPSAPLVLDSRPPIVQTEPTKAKKS
ncbi:uncharacterized protein ACA1_264500 [Acanthamoeba castellanii str. Neff]|uniref:Uncharacterized protein n=1 Tax=Acanthamoeba castellanii (strain ATCC 30010 / Neff) TaxID=1257118 RepID=L8H492_ACACF|nr:uncharacterized protein ACA1_264500 [Acanthamoeba castellanii str. Neff]ELR19276.1 hypothetical protein ACA1_264500 [Acanthamoeba castellanii str. Neff]